MDFLYLFLDFIKINLDSNFILTFFLFFIFLLFYNTLAIPGNLIFIASTGYFFGIYLGFFLSITSLVLGSLIFFIFSKFYLKKLFPKIYDRFSSKIDNYISNSSIEYLIIFRMIPGPPLLLQNLFLSILNIKKYIFIFSSFVGFTPIIFISVFVGFQLNNLEKIKTMSFNNIFSKEMIFVLIFFISLLVIRIFFKKK